MSRSSSDQDDHKQAFVRGGRSFSPSLMAALSFYLVSKTDVEGAAARQILYVAGFCTLYVGGATFVSAVVCVHDKAWANFVLQTIAFVFAVVIFIVMLLYNSSLSKIVDHDKSKRSMQLMQANQQAHFAEQFRLAQGIQAP